MKHLIKCCIIFILFFCSALNAQTDPEFLKYFTKVKTIKLDEKALISFVYLIDVDNAGKILVTDKSDIFLFDPNGRLLKKLNSDECSPGIKWFVPRAMFKQDGEILKMNTLPGGVRFKNDGTCFKKYENNSYNSLVTSSFTDGSVINYIDMNIPGFSPFNIFTKEGKPVIKFGRFIKGFDNALRQIMYKGGIVVDNKDIIYHSLFNNAEINKYDKTGKLLGTIFRKPDRYIPMREDMPKIDPTKIKLDDKKSMEDFEKKFNKYYIDYTHIQNLFLMDYNLLLLMYAYHESSAIQVFNTNGTYLLNKDLNLDKKSRLLMAKNGNLYFLVTPDYKNTANISNPFIEVYKYTGKKK